jgi:acyl dehydratase
MSDSSEARQSVAGDDGATVRLDRPPATGSLLRRAALGALPAAGRRRTEALPDTTLTLDGTAVDRARLAAYDRVCGFRLGDALPPTYPHILAFPLAMLLMSDERFPFPVIGLVHVANRIEVRRPVDADERLDLAVHAENLRAHDRGRQFDVVSTASVDGVPVWRGVSTYLRRETARLEREKQEQPEGSEERGRDGGGPATPGATWRVPARTGRDYAAVSGDRNPIHTSRLGARVFGFPRPIAHGMWTKARCLAALEGRLPDAYTVEVSFKRPIGLPATVAFTAAPQGNGWSLALSGATSGKPHLVGTVTDG